MAAAINMRAPIAKNYRISVAPSAIGKINHGLLRVGQESLGRCHAGRTPRVSGEPEWAAREKTQPAHGSPCATGAACQRGTAASWGRVVTSNAQPIESLPPGALGGVLMVCGHGLRAPRADLGNRVKASLGEVAYCFVAGNYHGNSMAASAHLQSIPGRGVMIPSPLQSLWRNG